MDILLTLQIFFFLSMFSGARADSGPEAVPKQEGRLRNTGYGTGNELNSETTIKNKN